MCLGRPAPPPGFENQQQQQAKSSSSIKNRKARSFHHESHTRFDDEDDDDHHAFPQHTPPHQPIPWRRSSVESATTAMSWRRQDDPVHPPNAHAHSQAHTPSPFDSPVKASSLNSSSSTPIAPIAPPSAQSPASISTPRSQQASPSEKSNVTSSIPSTPENNGHSSDASNSSTGGAAPTRIKKSVSHLILPSSTDVENKDYFTERPTPQLHPKSMSQLPPASPVGTTQ
jgi:hypothetical protein